MALLREQFTEELSASACVNLEAPQVFQQAHRTSGTLFNFLAPRIGTCRCGVVPIDHSSFPYYYVHYIFTGLQIPGSILGSVAPLSEGNLLAISLFLSFFHCPLNPVSSSSSVWPYGLKQFGPGQKKQKENEMHNFPYKEVYSFLTKYLPNV